jgi:hypothetical protein
MPDFVAVRKNIVNNSFEKKLLQRFFFFSGPFSLSPRITTHSWGTSTLLSLDEVTTTQTTRQLLTRQTTARQSTQTKLVTTRLHSSIPTFQKEGVNQAWLIVLVVGGVLLGITTLGIGLLFVRFCRRRIRYSGLVRNYH